MENVHADQEEAKRDERPWTRSRSAIGLGSSDRAAIETHASGQGAMFNESGEMQAQSGEHDIGFTSIIHTNSETTNTNQETRQTNDVSARALHYSQLPADEHHRIMRELYDPQSNIPHPSLVVQPAVHSSISYSVTNATTMPLTTSNVASIVHAQGSPILQRNTRSRHSSARSSSSSSSAFSSSELQAFMAQIKDAQNATQRTLADMQQQISRTQSLSNRQSSPTSVQPPQSTHSSSPAVTIARFPGRPAADATFHRTYPASASRPAELARPTSSSDNGDTNNIAANRASTISLAHVLKLVDSIVVCCIKFEGSANTRESTADASYTAMDTLERTAISVNAGETIVLQAFERLIKIGSNADNWWKVEQFTLRNQGWTAIRTAFLAEFAPERDITQGGDYKHLVDYIQTKDASPLAYIYKKILLATRAGLSEVQAMAHVIQGFTPQVMTIIKKAAIVTPNLLTSQAALKQYVRDAEKGGIFTKFVHVNQTTSMSKTAMAASNITVIDNNFQDNNDNMQQQTGEQDTGNICDDEDKHQSDIIAIAASDMRPISCYLCSDRHVVRDCPYREQVKEFIAKKKSMDSTNIKQKSPNDSKDPISRFS